LLRRYVELFAATVQHSRRGRPSAAPKGQELIGSDFNPLWADFLGGDAMQDFRFSVIARTNHLDNEFH
jgi:hypothetical protein